jgi:anti-sigma B factor antagonist
MAESDVRRRGRAMGNEVQFEVVDSESGLPVLRAWGEIDVASAPDFHASLYEVIGQDADTIVVDLSDVSFIDSTGLGVLVGAETQAREEGKGLRLVVTQPQILRLLELTGLDEVFTVVSNTRDAVTT